MTLNERHIPASMLADLFDMDMSALGILIWLSRHVHHFSRTEKRSAEHVMNNWNSRYSGKIALAYVDPSGHLQGRINGRIIYAHRAVWAINYGAWPEQTIDHINGIPSDNRIANLRDVPHILNMRNTSGHKTNSTGVNGVSRFKRDGNFVASIMVKGKSVHLGYFNTLEEASSARVSANKHYGFHENHGRLS